MSVFPVDYVYQGEGRRVRMTPIMTDALAYYANNGMRTETPHINYFANRDPETATKKGLLRRGLVDCEDGHYSITDRGVAVVKELNRLFAPGGELAHLRNVARETSKKREERRDKYHQCVECKTERTPDQKHWRGRYCNKCYMRKQNSKRSKNKRKRTPVKRQEVDRSPKIEEEDQSGKFKFSHHLECEDASIYQALEAITGEPKKELLKKWIRQEAEQVIEGDELLTLDRMEQTGFSLLQHAGKTTY